MIYFKALVVVLIGIGVFALQSWDSPVWLANTILLGGAGLGLGIIAKDKGLQQTMVPVVFWLLAFGFYGLLRFDQSPGLESLRWGTFVVVSAVAAVISTIVLMFKKTKSK